ncbi:hypothetical protein EZV62_022848 [Acer yangbiense]|uniref:DUF4228 domain-containing protein n=1 Tax=Acer yangbiense TaxID=1000413 RepID=A0A5C7GZW2_9ROSI|nr:hypothetical protein EZV62_022848 [Acer yangbiense]
MGNCQAIDAATLVIQHPCGKVDKFYWPVSASEIMRNNPGHYVALLISTTLCNNSTSTSSHQTNNNNNNNNDKCPNTTTTTTTTTTTNNNGSSSVRLTRIKLLRPTDTLVLGQVYRLITSQDVMKGLLAKKNGKKNKNITPESAHHEKPRRSDQQLDNYKDNNNHQVIQVMKYEKHRPRTASSAAPSSAASSKSRIWQPSLQSISEAAS